LKQYGLHILGVDFDPQKIKTSGEDHLFIRYGDAEDVEFTKLLPLTKAKWVGCSSYSSSKSSKKYLRRSI